MSINQVNVEETSDFLLKVTIKDIQFVLEDPQVETLIRQLIEKRESVKWKRNAWIAGTEWVAVAGSSLSPDFGKPYVEKD